MKLNIVVGLTAKPGGGKGTFVKLLREVCRKDNYFPSIGGPRFSDALRETLEMFGIIASRHNLQELAKCLNSACPGAIANGMRSKLEKDWNEIKIADGVRWLYDEPMVRGFANGLIVYVHATPEKRYERIRARRENPGDEEKTQEAFLAEDSAETEKYVEEIGSRAEYKIDNNGTLQDYEDQVREFYQKVIKPLRDQQD